MKSFFISFLSSFFLISCTNDIEKEDTNSALNSKKLKAMLVDGRLHFNSEDDFKNSIEYLKSLKDEEVEALMYKFYEEGFKPLYPFYKEEDEGLIKEFIEKKRNRLNAGNIYMRSDDNNLNDDDGIGDDDPEAYIEPDDDLIGDDYFASLLNFDREIVIEEKLYKYTYEGVFRVKLEDKMDLDVYIIENNINEINKPDPNLIERGLVQVTDKIERFAPQAIGGCGNQVFTIQPYEPYPMFYNDIVNSDCNGSFNGTGGSYSGGSSTSSTPDHTESMKNYLKNLMPCDTQSGGIFGWNPFGTSRKCFSYHSSKHRVKTKYWNENLLVYTSIGVKVKHQRKNCCWWYARNTDEVALVINQAMFAITYPNQIPNYNSMPTFSSNNQRLYYYEGKFYDNFSASYMVATGWTPSSDNLVPKTPFQEDIIVQEYVDLPILRNMNDIEIEAKEINKLFWEQGVWNGVKTLMGRFGKTPRKMTYILTTPQKVYVNYIDLTQRRTNAKKIVDVLDYDWGGQISFKWTINGNGSWSSNINDWSNPLSYIEAFNFTELTDFETLSMDFVGMTRRGNTWKGSRIVYTKD